MKAATGKILVFARAPVPGQTKTRLVPALGEAGAARLHAELIHRTLANVTAPGNVEVELWCTPDTRDHFFVSCADTYGVKLRQQLGNDLGERMDVALAETLDQASWAILIGTDCPELTAADIKQASAMLSGDTDAVLGPATDGGYVLIGLRQSAPSLFTDMPWGSDQIAELTRERLRGLGMCWRELPTRSDIDRPEDLVHLNFDSKDSAVRAGDLKRN